MRELRTATPTNGGYGFLTWTNEGDAMITVPAPSRRVVEQPFLPPVPRDAFAFVGCMGQLVLAIPSLDMVIIRTGYPQALSGDPRVAPSSGAGDVDDEALRRLMQAVRDVRVPDPGPYERVRRYESLDLSKWLDLSTLLLALAPPGCTIARC